MEFVWSPAAVFATICDVSFSHGLQELFLMAQVIIGPLMGGVVLAGAILLMSADRRHHTFCLVIGAAIALVVQIVSSVMFFPGSGIFARTEVDPQRYFLYIGAISSFGHILFGYGLLMLGIIQFKLSRNPDFRR